MQGISRASTGGSYLLGCQTPTERLSSFSQTGRGGGGSGPKKTPLGLTILNFFCQVCISHELSQMGGGSWVTPVIHSRFARVEKNVGETFASRKSAFLSCFSRHEGNAGPARARPSVPLRATCTCFVPTESCFGQNDMDLCRTHCRSKQG